MIRYSGRGDVSQTDSPGPAGRGHNFFNGGNSASASASQNVNVNDRATDIDSGRGRFYFLGLARGYEGQNDHAAVTAIFFDAPGHKLGSASIGPVTNIDETKLLYRSQSGKVPRRPRRIQVTIVMTRAEGTLDDGYPDNLSLTAFRTTINDRSREDSVLCVITVNAFQRRSGNLTPGLVGMARASRGQSQTS